VGVDIEFLLFLIDVHRFVLILVGFEVFFCLLVLIICYLVILTVIAFNGFR